MTKSKKLYRSDTEKIIAGVAGGIAEFMDLDPSLIRLAFVILGIFGGGGVVIYIIMWLIVPKANTISSTNQETIKSNAQEIKSSIESATKDLNIDQDRSSNWLGWLMVGAGVYFLLTNFGYLRFVQFQQLWPVVLIVLGIYALTKSNK